MDLPVTVKMNLPKVVFIQEVVRNDQTLVIIGQIDVVRPGVQTQVHDAEQRRLLRFGYVQHHDLSRLTKRDDQPISRFGHRHYLWHRLRSSGDTGQVEHRLSGALSGVYEINEPIEHAGREGPPL